MTALLDNNDIDLTEFQLEAVKQLKDVFDKDFPLINFQQDVNFLTKHLYANDWNPQEAKEFPEWFPNKKVSEYLPILQTHSRYMLTDRDKNGKRIFVYKTGNFKFPEMTLKMSVQLDDLWLDAMLMDLRTQRNGVTVIADCKNTPRAIAQWLIPRDLKVASERTNLCPSKNLEIHLVNLSPVVNVLLKAVRPLLSERLQSKLHFHQSDWTLLHESVGKECLPEEYGGPPGKVVDYDKSYKFLLDKEDKLAENMKYGIS
ncbi:Alpha-tocopherol transfer protein-like [Pseudolycoriella hygida]|uniref:Alpha-tocopherol transfer protein-like n=1 Tax=Pseudolycoriella hygida TaxID=35572 RepID=A0A9Q0NGW6_9DIPT|nr:Alpha-tocopherol transfer protein-like [Pseudolycoriella hygida]